MHQIAVNGLIFLCLLGLTACGGDGTDTSPAPEPEPPAPSVFQQTTLDLPSGGQPAHTPGSPGVVVSNAGLIEQFGGADFSLNNARYTRYYLTDQDTTQADAILVLVPGFEGGASGFAILAENLLRRARSETSLVLEVWAVDRRSNQLEDTVGLDIAEREEDAAIGLDFLFGEQLSLELDPTLEDEVGRRALFYNSADDLAFMAQWTTLVHSQDIDAVVQAARDAALNANVFLGGHSAGAGFMARYAATDFNLTGTTPIPGFAKVRGLVMLEGSGGSLAAQAPDAAQLDQMEAAFDGGLYGAVRSQSPRCVDGETRCSPQAETVDCRAFSNTACTLPQSAYSEVAGLLSPQLFATSEVSSLEAVVQGDSGVSILQQDQGGIPGNNAIDQVPELTGLKLLLGTEPATSVALTGQFLDDDGAAALIAGFVSTSVGAPGPLVEGVFTWLGFGEEIPSEVLTDNGPAPTDLDSTDVWGVEVEPTDLEGRLMATLYKGQTNFSDWYYPSSGLSITSGLGLDTTALSAPPPLGRGRSDIDNRTQARLIDIPVIAFGGSNGFVPVSGVMLPYADSLAPCTAPSCDGITPRVLDREHPSTAFPEYGGAAGGFEVYISEGYAHVDVLTAEDDATNDVVSPLLGFIQRNLQ